MKIAFTKLTFIAFSLILSAFIFYRTAHGADFAYKNVVVINSYHEGIAWTDEQSDGILSVLKGSNLYCSIDVEYLDWKHHPTDENKKKFYDLLKYKYSNKKIDIIIVTDDAALDFTLKNRKSILSNAPVVFCGVNRDGIREITKGQINVTGIIEEINPENTLNLAFKIYPFLKNLYIIHDNTESGLSTGALAISTAKRISTGINIFPLNNMTHAEMINTITTLKSDSAVLITSYYVDKGGNIIEFEDFSRFVSSNSSVPVFHLYDFAMGHGGIGGELLSGRLQGEHAGRIALRILKGEDVNSIPIQTADTTRKIFDYLQLKKFDIPLSRIPKDAEIINKPYSFVGEHKGFVYSISVTFVLLVIFISILMVHIMKIRKVRRELYENNQELSALYEQLSAADEELKVLAFNDTLTGLANRLSLYEKLTPILREPSSTKGALLYIDIDNFKLVNDVMGHAFGDMFISKIGKKLSLLPGDNKNIFRIGGDEFIVCINEYSSKQELDSFASIVINAFREPVIINDSKINTSVSMGISLYPDDGSNIDEVLKNADIAMYKAKYSGKNKYVYYNPQMNRPVIERMQIEKYLRTAMDNNEFILHYQPRVNMKTGEIAGFEALIRWNNPELGIVSPNRFIEIAEESHQIISIGQWVLKSACGFIKSLYDKGYYNYIVSVNISILQLMQDDFVDFITGTLDSFGLSPNCLELEITESILMESFEIMNRKLGLLMQRGIKIALDDFGKGYSSLNYLKQLPISTLKIDKSFIDNITDSNNDGTLIDTIINMGHKIGLVVVAEGVEKCEQLNYLKECSCDEFQGYLFSRPIPEDEVFTLLNKS